MKKPDISEVSFEDRVKFTCICAMRLMEHPEEPLNLSQGQMDFFELNLVDFQGMEIPQRCVDFFELFFEFVEMYGINLKNIGSAIKQLNDQIKKIPHVKRPKNETELKNKITRLVGFVLSRSLIEYWKVEEKSQTGDEFKKYIIATSIVFSMVFQEIYNSYYFDVLGKIPSQYRDRRDHSIPLLKTYLCLRCEEVFFSISNNARHCDKCRHVDRMDKQKHRRNYEGDRPERCLYCHEVLPISRTKPKKYCDDACRYADRKKKIISRADSEERASF